MLSIVFSTFSSNLIIIICENNHFHTWESWNDFRVTQEANFYASLNFYIKFMGTKDLTGVGRSN